MAVIAKKCPSLVVTVVDTNTERIAAWNTDDLPVYEPELSEIVSECRGKNLFFSTDVATSIRDSDIIFVSVNTPTKTYGEGAGRAADLKFIELCARQIAEYSNSSKIVVEKSTIPVRTAESLKRILNANGGGHHFEIISNPEFLAEGTAIRDLEHPDRILIGGEETPSGRSAVATICQIYKNWIPENKIILTNLWSAELSKIVSNAFLAQRVSSINSISALCEVTGAVIGEVAIAVGKDSRIGPKFLQTSVGFGGSCFKKDILNLVYLCDYFGLHEVGEYWEQVIKINEWQKQRFVKQITKSMFNTVADKVVVVLGFAFKKDTNDTRESPAINVCSSLLDEHAKIIVHDPQVSSQIIKGSIATFRNVTIESLDHCLTIADNPYEAVDGAHALAILTEWDEYKQLDYEKIYNKMQKPAFIFDGRNILNCAKLKEIGFEVFSLGNPSSKLT